MAAVTICSDLSNFQVNNIALLTIITILYITSLGFIEFITGNVLLWTPFTHFTHPLINFGSLYLSFTDHQPCCDTGASVIQWNYEHCCAGPPKMQGSQFWQNVVQWRREWQTAPVLLLWEHHEQYEKTKINDTKRWAPPGHKVFSMLLEKSRGQLLIAPEKVKRLSQSRHESERTPGDSEGQGSWHAVVHEVTKNQTQLSNQTTKTTICTFEYCSFLFIHFLRVHI